MISTFYIRCMITYIVVLKVEVFRMDVCRGIRECEMNYSGFTRQFHVIGIAILISADDGRDEPFDGGIRAP